MEDEFGLSWQFLLSANTQLKVIPHFLFPKGKTKEAIAFYQNLFLDFQLNNVHYADEKQDLFDFSSFDISVNTYFAMDNLSDEEVVFNEAASMVVECETQEDIDYFWNKLAIDSNDGQCGWIKDPFGLSWQIVPKYLNDVFFDNAKKYIKLSPTMFKMKCTEVQHL